VKAQIRQAIYDVLSDEMKINLEHVNPTEELAPLADTDDWSFIFVPELERRLGISVPLKYWSKAGTVDEIVEMIEGFMQETR
jgi:hypothetical protein